MLDKHELKYQLMICETVKNGYKYGLTPQQIEDNIKMKEKAMFVEDELEGVKIETV